MDTLKDTGLNPVTKQELDQRLKAIQFQEFDDRAKQRWKKVYNYICLNEGKCVQHLKQRDREHKKGLVLKMAK